MTSPTPTLTPAVAPLPIPVFSPPVSPFSPVPATLPKQRARPMSQTSFGHISINYSTILTVLMAMENPWKDLLIDTSHVSKQSVLAKILGRSTGNHHGTCKGITLEVCLVTWVGSHLRAVTLPIAFSLSPIFPSATYCVIPLKLLLDLVWISVRHHENGALTI